MNINVFGFPPDYIPFPALDNAVTASAEQASWLREELLALHAAYEKSLERTLLDWLGDPSEAAHWATALASFLHGNMLLELGAAAGGERRSHTLHALLTLRGHEAAVSSVAVHPTASELASVSFDGTIRLWRGHRDGMVD